MRKEINHCTEQVSHAELRISSAKDIMTNLQARVHTVEKENKSLEDKLLDLEATSWLNNLSLINLLEDAKGKDHLSFLDKRIPDALGTALQSSVVLDRLHQIRPPRTLIMRFHNYNDKMEVMAAAWAKKRTFITRINRYGSTWTYL